MSSLLVHIQYCWKYHLKPYICLLVSASHQRIIQSLFFKVVFIYCYCGNNLARAWLTESRLIRLRGLSRLQLPSSLDLIFPRLQDQPKDCVHFRLLINISLYSNYFSPGHFRSFVHPLSLSISISIFFSDFESSDLIRAKYFPYQLVQQTMLHYAFFI